MRILFAWEAGSDAQAEAIASAKARGVPVKIPANGWGGDGHTLQHRRETVDIQQGQILEMGLGFTKPEARTLAVSAAERHDRRS